jgi:hypothetical protein
LGKPTVAPRNLPVSDYWFSAALSATFAAEFVRLFLAAACGLCKVHAQPTESATHDDRVAAGKSQNVVLKRLTS